MAYAFTVTGPVIRHVDNVKFCTSARQNCRIAKNATELTRVG